MIILAKYQLEMAKNMFKKANKLYNTSDRNPNYTL
jgi:hypothetical protein